MADKFDLKAIISAVDKVTPTLKGIQRSVRLTGKTIKDIGSAGRSLTTGLGIPAGLAFGSVIYGAIRATRAALEYASGIQDAADRSGGGIESYQALVNMLGQVGGSAEDAGVAIKTFDKGVAAAASGADKSFAGLMRKLKIPLKDAHGQIRSLSDVLPELADGFAKNTNPALRTRMAMEFFGKSGTKLIPVLAKGSAAMRQWIAEQQRLGLIVDRDSIGAVDDLGDSLAMVNTQIKAQLTTSLAKLVPVLMPIIKGMTEWIGANKELIQANVVAVVKDVAAWIKATDWQQVARDIRDAFGTVRSIVAGLGGLRNVLIGFGALFMAGPVASLLAIGGAIARFVSGIASIALANPVVLAVVAVIALLAGAAYLVYKNWEPIKAFFANFWSNIGQLFGSFLGWLTGNFVAGLVGIVKTIGGQLGAWVGLFVDIWTKPRETAEKFFNWITDKISGVIEIAKVLFGVAKTIGGAIFDFNASAFSGFGSGFKSAFTGQTPLVSSGALQAANGRQQLTGDMTVRFENAPQGMRVTPGKTNQPGVSMNPDVGYRSFSFGL